MIQLICGKTERELETFESEAEAKATARDLITKGYFCYLIGGNCNYGIRDWGREMGKGSDWNAFIRWHCAADYYDQRLKKARERIHNIKSHPGGKYYLANHCGYFMAMERGTMICTDILEDAIAFATAEDAQSFKEDFYFAGFRILNAIAFSRTQQDLNDFLDALDAGDIENYSYR